MSWLVSAALLEAFESSCASPEGGADSLPPHSSDGARFARLNVMHTQHPFWHNDKTMESWSPSQFGLTCSPLTADRGGALLTWFREVFLARTSPVPAEGQESKARIPASGNPWSASLAKYDPASLGWKTPQFSLLGDLESFSETWPRWGTVVGGELYPLRT